MHLRYKIEYGYDFATNSVMLTLVSDYTTKDYRVPNITNLLGVMSTALADFNEIHKEKIEELQNEEAIQAKREAQSNSKELKPKPKQT